MLSLEFEHHPGVVRVGGISGVMTFPEFRHEGPGTAVMARAARHVRETRMDVGMLFCGAGVEPFYRGLGWRRLPPGRVLVNDSVPTDLVMTLGDARAVPEPLRLDWSW